MGRIGGGTTPLREAISGVPTAPNPTQKAEHMTRTECKVLAATTRLPIPPHRQNAFSNWDVSAPERQHTFASPFVNAYVMRNFSNPRFREPSDHEDESSEDEDKPIQEAVLANDALKDMLDKKGLLIPLEPLADEYSKDAVVSEKDEPVMPQRQESVLPVGRTSEVNVVRAAIALDAERTHMNVHIPHYRSIKKMNPHQKNKFIKKLLRPVKEGLVTGISMEALPSTNEHVPCFAF